MIEYIFVIDTDRYSGNFERELCAYCTGTLGHCMVGKDHANMFYADMNITEDENPFNDYIGGRHDDHGVWRPCQIYPTPGWGNDGMGKHVILTEKNKNTYKCPAYQSVAIYFFEWPTKDHIDLLISRAKQFCSMGKIKISKFRLLSKTVTTSELNSWSIT